MEMAFYCSGLVAILGTLRVITHSKPVYAIVYLIISLLAIACIFFSLSAYLAGALEIIIYAGAIIVMFVFVVMILNVNNDGIQQERAWLNPRIWIGPSLLSFVLLSILVYGIARDNNHVISVQLILNKTVGITLFGPYILAVELSSMLLLSGLVVSFHLCQQEESKKIDQI